MISNLCYSIFKNVIDDYHETDNVNAVGKNPFETSTFEFLLYQKCWIDSVQWHLEDIIRNPDIDPVTALNIKRRIDMKNHERTNIVEDIDDYFLEKYKSIEPLKTATFNTESPAWAIDRLAIMSLRIYHMQKEAERKDAAPEHREFCRQKFDLLLLQKLDLSTAIDELIGEIEQGKKKMRVYKQMKMYNDPSLNPVLYDKKSSDPE